MGIIEIKAKKQFAEYGVWAWLAEALVEKDKGETVYVTAHYYDGEIYSVSKQSVYIWENEPEEGTVISK